jgi:hypothetical protein
MRPLLLTVWARATAGMGKTVEEREREEFILKSWEI